MLGKGTYTISSRGIYRGHPSWAVIERISKTIIFLNELSKRKCCWVCFSGTMECIFIRNCDISIFDDFF